MIDWSKYPYRTVRRAEQERCAEVCSKITGQHIKAESTKRTIEERSAEIAQDLGAAECRHAIEALGDED